VTEFFEEIWEALPEDLRPPELERRSGFLRAALHGGERVLDIGCGAGDFTSIAAHAGAEPIGVDVAQAAVARARNRFPKLDFQLVPIHQPLPFEDGSFDVVWASEVIEHVADTGRWLSEVRRVLAPSGRLLITTPSHGRGRLLLGGIERFSPPTGDHLHLYSARSLRRLLGEFGFDEVSVRAVGGPPLLKRLLLARARVTDTAGA
jgi:ubiquinone/menaquinone biosynthesis C-methylase UbiE